MSILTSSCTARCLFVVDFLPSSLTLSCSSRLTGTFLSWCICSVGLPRCTCRKWYFASTELPCCTLLNWYRVSRGFPNCIGLITGCLLLGAWLKIRCSTIRLLYRGHLMVWVRLLYEQKGSKSITNIYHDTN